MAAKSLGKVTSASTSTGTRFTVNAASFTPAVSVTAAFNVQGYAVQAFAANTGVVYICNTATPDLTTGIGVCGVLPIPATADSKALPIFAQDDPTGKATFNLAEMYILPAVANEGGWVYATRS